MFMRSVVMQSVFILNVIMLSVVALSKYLFCVDITNYYLTYPATANLFLRYLFLIIKGQKSLLLYTSFFK
jgi:hypothetical protein